MFPNTYIPELNFTLAGSGAVYWFNLVTLLSSAFSIVPTTNIIQVMDIHSPWSVKGRSPRIMDHGIKVVLL